MARLLQIFRAGRHVASDGSPVTMSARELDEIAASYDPAKHEAPIVIGHPRENAPAFGWIQALATRGGALEAVPAQLEPAFAEAVRAGRYKKVSASFYRPDSPSNPTPGKWYLRHVGFLGAQPPAVKGLRAVAFADGDPAEVVEVEAAAAPEPDAAQASTLGGALTPLRDWLSTTYGPEVAERAIPEATLEGDDMAAPMLTLAAWIGEHFGAATPAPSEAPAEGEAPTADHAERRARAMTPAQRQRAEELAKREAELVRRERELRRSENVSFLEGLVRDGRPLPAPREDLLGLLDTLSAAPKSRELAASFAEGEVRTPVEIARDMLQRMPRQVDFVERSGDGNASVGSDPREVARAAQVHQAELAAKGIHISTTDAVRAVKGGR